MSEVAYALTSAKTDERDTALSDGRTQLNARGISLIRPTFDEEPARAGQPFLRPFRQIIESINQTLKAQLELERHGGLNPAGVCARVLQRLLALTYFSGPTIPSRQGQRPR